MAFYTKTFVILFLILGIGRGANADALNLKTFVQKYLDSSLNIAVSNSNKSMSEESLKSSQSNYYPTLSLNADYSKMNPLDDGFSDGATEGSLKLSQNIFNGFRNKNAIDSKKVEVRSAQYSLKQKKHDETIAAINLYFSYLIQQKELKHLSDEISSNESILKEVKRNFSYGNAKKSQVLSLESTIASLNVEKSEAEVSLKKILNAINLKLKTNFQTLALVEEDLDKEYKYPQVEAQFDMEKRYDYKITKINIEKASLLIEENRNAYLPSLDLAFAYKVYVNDFSKSRGNEIGDQSVALNLSLPFPWSIDKNSKIASSRYGYEMAHFESLLKEQELKKEVEDLKLDLIHLSKQLDEVQKTLKLSTESLRITKKEFISGLSSYSDYLNSFTANQKVIRQFDRIKLQLNQKIMETQLWSHEFEFN